MVVPVLGKKWRNGWRKGRLGGRSVFFSAEREKEVSTGGGAAAALGEEEEQVL